MGMHHCSAVNALCNPVTQGDVIIAASGERYQVCQGIMGEYWLRHIKSGQDLTRPISGQIGICSQIAGLENI